MPVCKRVLSTWNLRGPLCGRSEHLRIELDSAAVQELEELRTNAGGFEITHDGPFLVLAPAAKPEDLLHGDGFFFHSENLGDGDQSTTPVLGPLGLHHDMDGRGDLLTDGSG